MMQTKMDGIEIRKKMKIKKLNKIPKYYQIFVNVKMCMRQMKMKKWIIKTCFKIQHDKRHEKMKQIKQKCDK